MSSPAPVTAEMNAISPVRGCSPESRLAQCLPQCLDLGRMRSVVDGNPRGRHVIPLARAMRSSNAARVPGDDGRRRTVLRGNGDRSTPWFDKGVNPFNRPRDRDHAAGSRDCPDRLATQRDDLRGVSQREGARDIGGSDLALRMAEDGVGLDSQRSPMRGQRHHHREQHGLHHIDPVEARRTRHRPARPRAATSRRIRRKRHRRAASDRRTPARSPTVRPPSPSTAIPGPETRRPFPPWNRRCLFPCPPRRKSSLPSGWDGRSSAPLQFGSASARQY